MTKFEVTTATSRFLFRIWSFGFNSSFGFRISGFCHHGLTGGADFVGSTVGGGVRRFVQEVGGFFSDAKERLREGVEGFLAFGLGRFDHHCLFDDRWKINGWRMIAVV